MNNLKDVSVELPKRRLTVFTGVSGSGKSSLVFGTIAAESQRLINETYSTFVQGFMPTHGPPRRRRPRRPDHRDHRRPGADGRGRPLHGRHRHRRQRDAAHPLQPAREAAHRGAAGVLLQRRLGQGERRDHRPAWRQDRDQEGDLHPHRRHVHALRGPRLAQRLRPVGGVRRGASRSTRARSPCPATAWRAGTAASTAAAASSTRTSRSRSSTSGSSATCSTRTRPRSRSRGSTSRTPG